LYDAANVTFDAATLTGQTILIYGDTIGHFLETVTINGTESAEAINLGGITLDEVQGLTINGLDGDDTINGSLSDDTITGGAGADTITSGGGADNLTGGAGRDTFSMVRGDATDTITDFTVADDFLAYNTALLSIDGTKTTPDGFISRLGGSALDDAATVFELLGATTDGSASDLVAKLGGTAINSNIDIGDAILFINYLTSDTAQVWSFVDANGANVDAAELMLLVTLTGVAAYSMGPSNI